MKEQFHIEIPLFFSFPPLFVSYLGIRVTMASSSNAQTPSTQTSITMNNPQLNFNFFNPVKLGITNYILWKTQVLSSIRANACEGFIGGTNAQPQRLIIQSNNNQRVTTLPNPDFLIWQRQDQALMSWLLSSMTKEVLGHVTSCTLSLELWRDIESSFSSQTKAKILQLRMQLQNSKKWPLTVTDYYTKVKMKAANFIASSTFISDEELILYILGGLGSEYDLVVVNIIAITVLPTLKEVYSLLLTHESRVDQCNSAGLLETPNNNANIAKYS